tara:strand:+ start:1338 stop:1844 length:507 start_codon:yes stop_codon:yes gene_type:complete
MKRGPRKVKVDYGRVPMYKAYLKDNKEDKTEYSVYSKVLNCFNKKISEKIMKESFEYIIPYRLGIIRIKKYKPSIKIDKDGNLDYKGLSPNWKATKELWEKDEEAKKTKKIVFHINDHSDGFNYKWHFSNYRSNCENRSVYSFVPTRTNKRTLAELIKDEEFTGDFYM